MHSCKHYMLPVTLKLCLIANETSKCVIFLSVLNYCGIVVLGACLKKVFKRL